MAGSTTKSAADEIEAFFSAERPKLARYLARQTGSQEDAEDLVQEAWIRLARNAAHAGRAPRGYLRTILQSVITDFRRGRDRRQTDRHQELTNSIVVEAPSPEDHVVGRSEIACLELALAELPKRRRDIFIRANLRGESCATISKTYGLSKRTIELEVKAALDHCAERLGRKRA